MTPIDISKLTELADKLAAAVGGFSSQVWTLLVNAQRALALADYISAAMGIVFAVSLYGLSWRMAQAARKSYAQADESDRADVMVPGAIAVAAFIMGAVSLHYVWETLPLAVARNRYPEAFAAKDLIDRLPKPPP